MEHSLSLSLFPGTQSPVQRMASWIASSSSSLAIIGKKKKEEDGQNYMCNRKRGFAPLRFSIVKWFFLGCNDFDTSTPKSLNQWIYHTWYMDMDMVTFCFCVFGTQKKKSLDNGCPRCTSLFRLLFMFWYNQSSNSQMQQILYILCFYLSC